MDPIFDEWDSNLYDRLNSGLKNIRFSFNDMADAENFMFGFDPAPDPRERQPRDNITTRKPRKGFVNGGYILTEGFVVTKKDFIEMKISEWREIQGYVESHPNLLVNQIPTGVPGETILHCYDAIPTITTMEA